MSSNRRDVAQARPNREPANLAPARIGLQSQGAAGGLPGRETGSSGNLSRQAVVPTTPLGGSHISLPVQGGSGLFFAVMCMKPTWCTTGTEGSSPILALECSQVGLFV